MATRYFADTFYFVALLCPGDEAHARAVDLGNTLSGGLVTTDAVLLELADTLSSPDDRQIAAHYVRALWQDPAVTVHPVDRTLMQRGLALYAAREDKDWGLTDCISFVVMEEEGIREALTGDRHFEQAGFTPLFLTDR
jgi:hypothetical protein